MENENILTLKVGDIFRENRARVHRKIVGEFVDIDTKKEYFVIKNNDTKNYAHLEITSKKSLENVYGDDSFWSGIVELNGVVVRGRGGILLDTPKEIKPKVKKEKRSNTNPTKLVPDNAEFTSAEDYDKVTVSADEFYRFLALQNSGTINMLDIINGARLTKMSEAKYTNIIWNYDKYISLFKIK